MNDLYINFADRPQKLQEVDQRELSVLDKDSITSINDFMLKFAEDKSFSPPESSMVFDSDIADIDIDSDEAPSMAYDFEDADEDQKRARAQS